MTISIKIFSLNFISPAALMEELPLMKCIWNPH